MADSALSSRVEPSIGPSSVSAVAAEELRGAAYPATSARASDTSGSPAGLDQLSRIEDKTARIEEKYARSEAILQRVGSTVEAATSRMNEVASQTELAAVRSEVREMAAKLRGVPGKGALAVAVIATSLLTAVIFLALIQYGMVR